MILGQRNLILRFKSSQLSNFRKISRLKKQNLQQSTRRSKF
jgi:hypothetical protein